MRRFIVVIIFGGLLVSGIDWLIGIKWLDVSFPVVMAHKVVYGVWGGLIALSARKVHSV